MRVKLGTGINNNTVTIELSGYGEITISEIKNDVIMIREVSGRSLSITPKASNAFELDVLS